MKEDNNVSQTAGFAEDYLAPDVEVVEINVWRTMCTSIMSDPEEDDLN